MRKEDLTSAASTRTCACAGAPALGRGGAWICVHHQNSHFTSLQRQILKSSSDISFGPFGVRRRIGELQKSSLRRARRVRRNRANRTGKSFKSRAEQRLRVRRSRRRRLCTPFSRPEALGPWDRGTVEQWEAHSRVNACNSSRSMSSVPRVGRVRRVLRVGGISITVGSDGGGDG